MFKRDVIVTYRVETETEEDLRKAVELVADCHDDAADTMIETILDWRSEIQNEPCAEGADGCPMGGVKIYRLSTTDKPAEINEG